MLPMAKTLFILGLFERHLEGARPKTVPIERLNGTMRVLVLGHGDKAKPFALVGVEVADHLDVVDGPKRAKELPEEGLLALGRKVVDKQTPAIAIVGHGL